MVNFQELSCSHNQIHKSKIQLFIAQFQRAFIKVQKHYDFDELAKYQEEDDFMLKCKEYLSMPIIY